MCDCCHCGRHEPCSNEGCANDVCPQCEQVPCDQCGTLIDEDQLVTTAWDGRYCSDDCASQARVFYQG